MHQLAVHAWGAYEDETYAAVQADGSIDNAAFQAAKQRFEGRILSTAEPDAVQWYNLKMRANPKP